MSDRIPESPGQDSPGGDAVRYEGHGTAATGEPREALGGPDAAAFPDRPHAGWSSGAPDEIIDANAGDGDRVGDALAAALSDDDDAEGVRRAAAASGAPPAGTNPWSSSDEAVDGADGKQGPEGGKRVSMRVPLNVSNRRPSIPMCGMGAATSLAFSVVLQGCSVFLSAFAEGLEDDLPRLILLSLNAILQIVQICVTTTSIWYVVHNIKLVLLLDAWLFYVATVLCFGGVYCAASDYIGPQNAFLVDSSLVNSGAVTGSWLYFYSLSTQTIVGYGDVSPLHPFTKAVTLVQILIALFFHVFIISNTLSSLRTKSAGIERTRNLSLRQRLSRLPWLRRLRRLGRKYLLVITLVVQTANYVVLYAAETNVFALDDVRVDLLMPSVILQVIQLVIVISTSLKLARKKNEVTLSFLAQSYVSVTLAFAGIYVVVFLIDPHKRPFSVKCNKDDPSCSHSASNTEFWSTVYRFIYFSLGTMTTTGYGDVVPRTWYARVAVGVQCLVSVFYSTVIFGLGLRQLSRYEAATRRGPVAPFDAAGTAGKDSTSVDERTRLVDGGPAEAQQ